MHDGRSVDRMERKTTCRYLRTGVKGQCTGEAADPYGEILLCLTHMALVLELIKRKQEVPA